MTSLLRIAQVAPPAERVPPEAYGGTERIVGELTAELVRRGHAVTTFASGDSLVPGTLVPTAPRALRPADELDDFLPWSVATIRAVLERAEDFDVIHAHLDVLNLLLAAASPVPVVATFHGRLDGPAVGRALAGGPGHLVAISHHQAATRPDVAWAKVIHHGLTLRGAPFDRRRGEDLAFVGRLDPEKGALDAIEVARRSGRKLRIAAKIGPLPRQQAYFTDVVRPALDAAGSAVEFVGELEARARDELFATSWATLMPGAWPEPFGLVAIESLACGTPVLARRVGALPEIIREGVDGYFGDDVQHLANLVDRAGELDRPTIRHGALERFGARRMVDQYETLYYEVVARGAAPGPNGRGAVEGTAAGSNGRSVAEETAAGSNRPDPGGDTEIPAGFPRLVGRAGRPAGAGVPDGILAPIAVGAPDRRLRSNGDGHR